MFKKIKSYIPNKFKNEIKNYIKYTKTRSFKEINSKLSYITHNSELEEDDAYSRELKIHNLKNEHTLKKEGIWNNIYNSPFSVGNFLDTDKEFSKLIDIGSGTGWFVNFVALKFENIKTIYAIEPSKAGIELSLKIYGHNNKIRYLNGFADKELSLINKGIYIVTSFAVFQHLNRNYTKKVLKSLNKILAKNSIIFFSEPIASSSFETFKLHYPRTKKFWRKNMKNFEVNFYDNNLIIAKKIKDNEK